MFRSLPGLCLFAVLLTSCSASATPLPSTSEPTMTHWDDPESGQSSQNFPAILQELRAALPDRLLTTAVVSYDDANAPGIPTESFELFGFVNIMAYDGPDHGSMDQFQGGLSYWSGRGLSKEKFVMGVLRPSRSSLL